MLVYGTNQCIPERGAYLLCRTPVPEPNAPRRFPWETSVYGHPTKRKPDHESPLNETHVLCKRLHWEKCYFDVSKIDRRSFSNAKALPMLYLPTEQLDWMDWYLWHTGLEEASRSTGVCSSDIYNYIIYEIIKNIFYFFF